MKVNYQALHSINLDILFHVLCFVHAVTIVTI